MASPGYLEECETRGVCVSDEHAARLLAAPGTPCGMHCWRASLSSTAGR